MDDLGKVCAFCILQAVLTFICLVYGAYVFWTDVRGRSGTFISPHHDIGFVASDDVLCVNPASYADIIMNDPAYYYSPPEAVPTAGRCKLTCYAKQKIRALLKESILGNHLPLNLAFLRRSLLMMDQNKLHNGEIYSRQVPLFGFHASLLPSRTSSSSRVSAFGRK